MLSKMILSIRSPSPTIHTIRRRSPSPIKTGVVNRARTRFETSGCEQGGHQTLPRAFKLGASSRVNIAERTVAPKSGLSGPMRTSEPLVTSSYRTDMVQVGFIRFPIHTIHSIVTKSEYSIPSKCCIGNFSYWFLQLLTKLQDTLLPNGTLFAAKHSRTLGFTPTSPPQWYTE